MEQGKQTIPPAILVVDDDENTRELLEVILAADGHAVRSAASGEEALAAVAAQLPDLILLDVMMHGIDGFEVTRRLKADARTRPIPIILVTSMDDRESRLMGLEAGAEEFLSKPVDRAELQVRVRNLLKVREYQDFLADHNRILEEQVRERTAALRSSERKYRNLADNSLVGIYKSNLKGEFLYINDAALRLYEYESREEFISDGTMRRYKNPEDRKVFIENLKKEGALENYELEALTKSGKTKIILVSATLDGEELSGMIMDITERKQAEAMINEQLNELRRWHEATMGREMRTIELKREINELPHPSHTVAQAKESSQPNVKSSPPFPWTLHSVPVSLSSSAAPPATSACAGEIDSSLSLHRCAQ